MDLKNYNNKKLSKFTAKSPKQSVFTRPSLPTNPLKTKRKHAIPLLVTFSPASLNLNTIITKLLTILNSKKNFLENSYSFIAYRRLLNLHAFLVKDKLKHIQTTFGNKPMIRKCSNCNSKTHPIKQTIICASKKLIVDGS